MGCANALKEEFQCKNFCMNHEDPSLFVKAQCFHPFFHVVLVTFWFLFFISTLVFELIYYIDLGSFYFTFLTNVTFCVQFAFVILDFTITLHAHCSRRDIVEGLATSTPWYMRLEWVLWNVVANISLAISVGYYSMAEDPLLTHSSINLHIVNSVHTLSVLLLSAKPMRILHFYQPMIYISGYFIFSLIYNLAGEYDALYGVEGPLDWKNKRTRTIIATTVAAFVATPIFHAFLWCVHKLRVWLAEKCGCHNKVTPRDNPKPRRNNPLYDDMNF